MTRLCWPCGGGEEHRKGEHLRRVLVTEEACCRQEIEAEARFDPASIVASTLPFWLAPYYRLHADRSLEGAFLTGLLGCRVVGTHRRGHHHILSA